jgi:zinc protease
VPADGVAPERVEAAIDAVLADLRDQTVTEAELERAKTAYLADYIYESDNQATLARRYGWGLVIGRTVADIEQWPERISKVTLSDIKKVAATYLDLRRSVTGTLLPVAPDGGSAPLGEGAMPSRS